MGTVRQRLTRLGFATAICGLAPVMAWADPVRLTIEFSVAGDTRLDPDHAGATSSGAFSVLTTLPTDSRVTNHDGFGATPVSFSWAGTTWTDADADVVQLGFDADGRLNLWTLAGFVAGSGTSSSFWPDFSVTFCGFCDSSFRMRFIYTTPRSAELGIFQGSLTSFTLTKEGEPMPTPEPISFLLAGTGLAGIFARRRWAGERGSSPPHL